MFACAVGDIDGTGAHLRLAGMDLNGDGSLSPTEYARFMNEAQTMIDNLQGSVQNMAVIAALILSLVVSLLLIEMSPPFEAGIWGPVSGGFFSQGSEEDALAMSHAFYVVEVILMSLTTVWCMVLLIGSIVMHSIVGSMPSRLSAITFVLENAKCYTYCNTFLYLAVFNLLLAFPFCVARYSLVAFFATIGVFMLTTALMFIFFFSATKWHFFFCVQQAKTIVTADKLSDSRNGQLDESSTPRGTVKGKVKMLRVASAWGFDLQPLGSKTGGGGGSDNDASPADTK